METQIFSDLWGSQPLIQAQAYAGEFVAMHYNKDLEKNIRFKLVEQADLSMFCRWMNDPRVIEFWDQAWSEEKQWQYLTTQLQDDFTLPLIGYFDEQPFGYIEVYWAELDRLAEYYQWQKGDRGIHLLVGEQSCRGPENFRAWMSSLSHIIYQSCRDTQRIVLEPRIDSERLLKRIGELGYRSQFEFDLPHKRAALVMGKRDEFYREYF